MSAPGQSRLFDRGSATSGLPRGTDIVRPLRHVANVPRTDSSTSASMRTLGSATRRRCHRFHRFHIADRYLNRLDYEVF
jgi:hypothetical protein